MSDLAPFSATTKPLVYLERDWNSLCDHGLEKTADYIIRVNGIYYEAIKGGTSTGAGTIAYGGENNAGTVDGTNAYAVAQATLDTPGVKHVHFGTGTFTLVTKLSPPTNMKISGNGYGTKIVTTGNIECFDIDNKSNVIIENIYFYGSDNTGVNTSNSLRIQGGDNVHVRNCYMENCYMGVRLDGGNNHTISDNKIYDVWIGVHIDSHGVYGEPTDIIINNNHILTTGEDGIFVDATGLTDGNVIVTNNMIKDTNDYGIDLTDADHVIVDGNVVDGTALYSGIVLGTANSRNCVISNNISKNCAADGIQATAGSNYNTITGNYCYNNGDCGIDMYSTTTPLSYNIVTGNICRDNAATGLRARETEYSVYTNNVAEGNAVLEMQFILNLGNIVDNNIGHRTRNCGKVTMLNGTQAIAVGAHGLPGVPTAIHVTGSSVDTEDVYVNGYDATNISWINAVGVVAGDRVIFWSAEYNVNVASPT